MCFELFKMKVYKDVFVGDEFISDAYAQKSPFDDPELNEIAFEVKTRSVVKNEDYGIPDNSEDATGIENNAETVIDIIDQFNLMPVYFSNKAEFLTFWKEYNKRLLKYLEEKCPGRVEIFKQKSNILAKKIVSMYDDLLFYMGSSGDMSAGLSFGYYFEGEITPRLVFLKDGLKEEKF